VIGVVVTVIGVTVVSVAVVGVLLVVVCLIVIVTGVGARAIVVPLVVAVAVRVPAGVLADAERDEKDAGDETHRAADPDAAEYRDRVVDLREIEVGFRVEENQHHRDTANEVANADDESREEAVHPLVRLVQRVGGCNRPAVSRFNAVDCPEGDCTEQEAGLVEQNHL
jgi:hypothetical protein